MTPPATGFDLEEATIADVQSAIGRGEISCRELVGAYLDRIEALDRSGPTLRSLLSVAPDALDQAAAQDASGLPADRDRPLAFVPVIVKDNIDTADLPTTGGARALEGMRPSRDATVVIRLRNAGAIVLAKSNLHELAMVGTTNSSLGGQTRNPYDLTRTPGGSSGGSGAAVAANLGLVGLGTDTGQSVRSPSSAQSLVGVRPTRGLVSRSGVMPCSPTQDEVGPMTRTVGDAARILDVMAGYDTGDPVTAAGAEAGRRPGSYLDLLSEDALSGARLGLVTELVGTGDPHREVNARLREVITAMESLGAEIEEITVPGLADLVATTEGTGALAGAVPFEMRDAFDAYLAEMANPPVPTLEALYERGMHVADIEPLLRRVIDGPGTTDPGYLAVLARRETLRAAVLDRLDALRLDAVLYPHQRRLVATIGERQEERNGILSNTTGLPAVVFPGGFSTPTPTAPIGVPIGVEILGRPFSEGSLLALAYAFERHVGLRRPPLLR